MTEFNETANIENEQTLENPAADMITENESEAGDNQVSANEGDSVINDESQPVPKLTEIIEAVQSASDICKSYLEAVMSTVQTNYLVSPKILDDILGYTMEEINTLPIETLTEFLSNYTLDDFSIDAIRDTVIDVSSDPVYADREPLTNESTDDDIRRMMLIDIKRLSLEVLDANSQKNQIITDTAKALSDSRGGKTVAEVMRHNLEEQLENTNPDDIATVNLIKDTLNYNFLVERINKYGDSEKDVLKKIFTDRNRGSYVIERYENHITKLGISEKNIWGKFVNLEEKYLPEEYHAFNNFFLFVYMRYIAYINMDSRDEKVRGELITREIMDLIYHQHEDREYTVLNAIKLVEDLFMDSVDWFNNNNTNSPNNPSGKARRSQAYDYRRQTLRQAYKNMNYTDHWDDNLDNDKLYENLSDYIVNQTESQLKEYNENKVRVEKTENENGDEIPTIMPNIPDAPNSDTAAETIGENVASDAESSSDE